MIETDSSSTRLSEELTNLLVTFKIEKYSDQFLENLILTVKEVSHFSAVELKDGLGLPLAPAKQLVVAATEIVGKIAREAEEATKPKPPPPPAPPPTAPPFGAAFSGILGMWSCQTCTLQNAESAERCIACGVLSPQKANAVWVCSSCTLENGNEVINCTACSNPSPKAKLPLSVFALPLPEGAGAVPTRDASICIDYAQLDRMNTPEFEAALANSFSSPPSYICCLCDECTTKEDGPQFIYGCSEKHIVCNNDFKAAFESDLNDNGGVGGPAKCAMCQGTSSYRLSIDEIARVYSRRSYEFQKYADILTRMHLAQDQNYIDCPSPDCLGKIYVPGLANLSALAKGDIDDDGALAQVDIGDGELQRSSSNGGTRGAYHVECLTCTSSFCLGCKRPYHTTLNCSQMSAAADAWFQWMREDSTTYKNQMKTKQIEVQEKLTEAMKTREAELARIEANYAALKQDEEEKARIMRKCPHCGVAFQKLDGCSSITCGKDASDKGGKTHFVKGCFKQFDMSQSLPYTAGVGEKKGLPNELKDLKVDEIEEIKHHIDHDKEFERHCQCCRQPIVGPRFSCINCPKGLDVCMTCCDFITVNNTSARGPDSAQSSSNGGDMAAAAEHSSHHIFMIFLQPS